MEVANARIPYASTLVQTDKNLISEYELQLNQGIRNAEQGEMGRALAISKLENIKSNIGTLQKLDQSNKEHYSIVSQLKEYRSKKGWAKFG